VNVGPTELLVIAIPILGLAAIGIVIWAIVDAANQPQAAWAAVGSNKTTWITLIAVFAFFCGIVGLILSIVYLASIRPKLNAAHT
jgi:hypothetical protein